jgi:predicted phosphate transport protein (TIGR00153 family)
MKFSNLLQYFSPKEKKFYSLFNDAAANIVVASEELMRMVNTEDAEERKAIRLKIKNLERKGDTFTNQVFHELHHTFITPFDREDIHGLASNMDDVLDFMNGVSEKIVMYRCTTFSTNMREMVKWVNLGCIELQKAIVGLEGLQKPQAIMKACQEINTIENRGDEFYHLAISLLFENEKDAIELIRQKEILLTIEKAQNKIEDVSDVIKTILVKYA